ncbi:MAG: DUF1778 domain-containing protein [Thermomicrobiales bacterium]
MAKQAAQRDADPLTPVTSGEDQQAKGWADHAEPLTSARRLEATISIRLGPDDAKVVSLAARLTGKTKSEFVRRATVEEARTVVERYERQGMVVERVERIAPTEITKAMTRSVETNGEARPPSTTAGTSSRLFTDVS